MSLACRMMAPVAVVALLGVGVAAALLDVARDAHQRQSEASAAARRLVAEAALSAWTYENDRAIVDRLDRLSNEIFLGPTASAVLAEKRGALARSATAETSEDATRATLATDLAAAALADLERIEREALADLRWWAKLGLLLSVIAGGAAVAAGLRLGILSRRRLDLVTRYADAIATDGRPKPLRLEGAPGEMRRLAASVVRLGESALSDRVLARDGELRDPDTGLLNRRGLLQAIEKAATSQAAEAARKRDDNGFGLLVVLSFPRLRWIENMLDARATTTAACEISACLEDMIERTAREDPSISFGARVAGARLGVDQLAVFVFGGDRRLRRSMLSRIANTFADPVEVRGLRLPTSPAVGVALWPDHAERSETLLNAAAAASAAAAPDGVANVFKPTMLERAMVQEDVQTRLAEAIHTAEDESCAFEAHYQPQICTQTGVIVGAEALVRWRQADGSLTAPEKFLPVAEESGQIVKLDDIMLRAACAAARGWREAGRPMRIAVNVSALAFLGSGFAERVTQRLEDSDLPPELLQLEITETVAIADPSRTAETLAPLRAKGVRIALDDFGSGHSNFCALRDLPIDCVKLDRALLPADAEDRQALLIFRSIAELSLGLGLEVIAEGIETPWHFELARSVGCAKTQGFLHGRPMDGAAFLALSSADGASDAKTTSSETHAA